MSDTLDSTRPRRSIRIIRKTIFAFAILALLSILSIIPNIGYHVYAKKEVSFVRHPISGYADVVFYCDMMYNPLLYPAYWMKGWGRIADNFTMIYIPESYRPGEFGGAIWGLTLQPDTMTTSCV